MNKSLSKPHIIMMILVFALIVIGAIAKCITHDKADEVKVETVSENEYIMQHVNQYGTYDNRVFTNEPSMDWSGNEYDFKPLKCKLDEETQEFVYYLCHEYDINWTLVMAVIKHESNFKADVISRTNDYGLMQINECNHAWLSDVLGVNDFLDPEQNIRSGVFVLRKLFEEYTDVSLVLMAYNMGESGATKLWDKGIYSTPYVESILKHQAKFVNQIESEVNDNEEM